MHLQAKPCSLRSLLLAGLLLGSPVMAQEKTEEKAEPDPAKQKALAVEKLNAELDKLEMELEESERYGAYVVEPVHRFAEELKQEFRRNLDTLQRMQAGELESVPAAQVETRQKLIPIYLWQLQRFAPTLLGRTNHNQSLMIRMSRLSSSNRDALSDRETSMRLQTLMRRASQQSRLRTSSYGYKTFYFVDPLEEPNDQIAKNQRNMDPFGGGLPLPAKDEDDDDESGAVAKLGQPLRLILKLGWREGNLAWDREHWDEPFGGKTIDDIAKDVQKELDARGVKSTEQNKRAMLMARMSYKRPPAALLFENLQHEAKKVSPVSSSGSSGSADMLRKRFEMNGLDAKMTLNGPFVEVTLQETQHRQRILRCTSKSEGELRINLIYQDRVITLDQKADGKVRLIDVLEDKAVTLSADSFAELYAGHPGVVEEGLFTELDAMGVQVPVTRMHPQVLERVLAKLVTIDEPTEKKFQELIEQTDAAKFEVRDRATRELARDMMKYLPLLVEANQGNTLPLEVKTRLKTVLAGYGTDIRELDTLISKMKLTSDAGYLIGIIPLTDGEQRELVLKRLSAATGKDYGTNLDAWNAWLASQ